MAQSMAEEEKEIPLEDTLEKINVAEKDNRLDGLTRATLHDIASIAEHDLKSKKRYMDHWSFKEKVKYYYTKDYVNNLNILVSLGYLGFCCVRSQNYRQMSPETWQIFYNVESCFTALFGIDFLINMISNCPGPFFASYWNWLDLFIIPASFYLVFNEVSDWDCILAMRTFKLFQKYAHRVEVASLYTAFLHSLNAAFVIIGVLLLAILLYAIAGIEWFHDVIVEVEVEVPTIVSQNVTQIVDGVEELVLVEVDGVMVPQMENVTQMVTEIVMEPYGEKYFGSQGVAMYSLLQVLSGDSWMSNITRRITAGERYLSGPIFFTSFTCLVSIIVMNLFASVFLDSFLEGKDNAVEEHMKTMSYYIFTNLGGDAVDGTVSRENLELLELKLRRQYKKFDVDELFIKAGCEDEDVIEFDTFYATFVVVEDRESALHKSKYEAMDLRLNEALQKITVLHDAQKYQTEKFEHCHETIFAAMQNLKTVAVVCEKEDTF